VAHGGAVDEGEFDRQPLSTQHEFGEDERAHGDVASGILHAAHFEQGYRAHFIASCRPKAHAVGPVVVGDFDVLSVQGAGKGTCVHLC
jgi:hypothetical protein